MFHFSTCFDCNSEQSCVYFDLIFFQGTSGDTGSAAIEAVAGLKFVDLIVLLPKGRCSRVQEQQMVTALYDNIHVFRGIIVFVKFLIFFLILSHVV